MQGTQSKHFEHFSIKKGAFNNYLVQILPDFDHPPPRVDNLHNTYKGTWLSVDFLLAS